MFDLIVKNANLPDGQSGVDIACKAGKIEAVEAGIESQASDIIEANGQFVVNLVPFELADKMFATSADIEYEVSEFETVNLTPEPSDRVKPPRVAESPVRFECEVVQVVQVGEGPLAANVVIGKILLIDIHESVLDDRQKIDPGFFKMGCGISRQLFINGVFAVTCSENQYVMHY